MSITPWADREAALSFIAAHQARPETATPFLGAEPVGLTAELDGLTPAWLSTLRVVAGPDGIRAASVVEWDTEATMAWIHGPWAEEAAWQEWAEPLLLAAIEQCPAEIVRFDFSGHVENFRLAALAERLGWTASQVNHAMVTPAGAVADWPRLAGVRAATAADLAGISALHEPEFPTAYATVRQLVTDHTTLVVERDGTVVGYAAGQLQDDGEAYIDFMAISDSFRRSGLGAGLLGELARALVAAGNPRIVHLTVEDSRAPARALYDSLGMRREASIRGYRWTRSAPFSPA